MAIQKGHRPAGGNFRRVLIFSVWHAVMNKRNDQVPARSVDELVVDDGGGQDGFAFLGFGRVFEAHDAALADDVAVFLAGDFLRHFEDHLDERVDWKLLRPEEQDAALADVFNNAFKPGAGAVDAEAQRNVELEAARTGHPDRSLGPRMAAANAGFGLVL